MAANLLWAGQGVAVKFLAGGLGPLATALLPLYCITILGLGILLLQRNVAQKFRTAWRLRRECFLAGICGQMIRIALPDANLWHHPRFQHSGRAHRPTNAPGVRHRPSCDTASLPI